jgi:hypothetical protein
MAICIYKKKKPSCSVDDESILIVVSLNIYAVGDLHHHSLLGLAVAAPFRNPPNNRRCHNADGVAPTTNYMLLVILGKHSIGLLDRYVLFLPWPGIENSSAHTCNFMYFVGQSLMS